MRGQIFICYRRDDSLAWARSLYDRLVRSFGRNKIFRDVNGISLGENFLNEIERRVGECDVLIAVIGARWLTSTDGQGRRLDDPKDFVRMEIGTALRRDIRVIPVLVDGVSMPTSTDLPDDLKQLVYRNALEIGDTHFDDDCRRLVAAIEEVLKELKHLKAQPLRSFALVAIAAVLLAGGPLIYFALHSPVTPVIPFPSATATPTVEAKAQIRSLEPRQPAPFTVKTISTPSISAAALTKEQLSRGVLDHTRKDNPRVNSLAMKFVPVAGTQVLFSIWDTRVQDFEMFVKDSGYEATGGMVSLDKTGWIRQGATWKKPGFKQGPTDPLVGVSWDDAKEFCKWLTKREHEDGGLIEGLCYRLPSDEEWSVAVGLKNEVAKTPEEKMNSFTNMLYPWGSEWPPPVGAGNYCGEESRIGNEPESWDVIQGYNDGYPRTSPVGSFASDKNSAASIQNASNAMTMYSTNFACYDNSASSKR
jgi:hypothetical protein